MASLQEIKARVDDAVSVLIEAADVDDAYWAALAVGQDSQQAEDSGYLAGYRDALSAVQLFVAHSQPEILTQYVRQVADEMHDREVEIEEMEGS